MPSSRVPNGSSVSVGGGGFTPPSSGSSGGGGSTTALLDHIHNPTAAHLASAIAYAGGPDWADGSHNLAPDVQQGLDDVIAGLANTNGSDAGTYKIGSDGVTHDSVAVSAGTLADVLLAMTYSSNSQFEYTSSDWADGSQILNQSVNSAITDIVQQLAQGTGSNKIGVQARTAWVGDGTTNPSGILFDAVNKIITDLGSQTTNFSGARKVRIEARTTWVGDSTTNPATTTFAAIDKIITDLGLQTTNASGARKVRIEARTNWLDGLTNPATTTFAAIDKIITDLADISGANANGASRIGFAAQGNLIAQTVEHAITELDTEKAGLNLANTFTNNNTFSGTGANQVFTNGVRVGSGGDYGFSSARNTSKMIDTSPVLISGTGWARDHNGLFTNGDPSDELLHPLDVADGTTLATMTCSFIVPTGHVGLPSSGFPGVGLYYLDITTGTRGLVQGAVYSTGSLSTYNNGGIKTLFCNLLNHVVNKTSRRYYVQFTCESGTNSLTGTTYIGTTISSSVSRVRYD